MADAGETSVGLDGKEKETGLYDGPNSITGNNTSPDIFGESGEETIGNPNKPHPAGNSMMDGRNPEVGGRGAKNFDLDVIQREAQDYKDDRREFQKAAEQEARTKAQLLDTDAWDEENPYGDRFEREGLIALQGRDAYNQAGPIFDQMTIDNYNRNYIPPIVIDLDGDGLDLVAIDKSKAMYDIDGDGYLENVGWVGDGDGFLSIDLNGDGLINEPKELAFALSTDDPNDTDLEGLAATYDSNQDGVLDAQDAEFAKFKVWIDIDQDGACDAGEVKTLANVGITSINLTSDNKEQVIAGNKVYGTTTYSKTDGTTGKVGDVGLATSAAGWKKEEVTGGIKFNYEGTGSNAGKSLFEAAAATALIMDVGASGLIGAMGAELDDSLSTSGKEDVILGGGAGNDKIKGGDGNDWLAGGEGIDSMNGGAGHDILFVDSEDKIDGGAGFDVAIVTDDRAVNYDLAKIGIEAVAAGAGDDVLNGGNLKDTALLDGGKGDDKLIGGKDDDVLSGGEGKDAMFGVHDDLIIMDADDDFKNIDGGAGWDRVVYLGDQNLNLNITDYNVEFFQAGDGNDVIQTDLTIQTDLDGGKDEWKRAA